LYEAQAAMGNVAVQKGGTEKLAQLYDVAEKLGTGSFATVKRCIRHKDGRNFALKVVKKKGMDAKELDSLKQEVQILMNLNHANIVKLYEVFDTSKKMYMVMDLLIGGELFDRIVQKGSFSEAEAASLIRQVTSALIYMHKNGVVHRDLKPENLLFETKSDVSTIKIIDFGLAKVNDDAMRTPCGTPGYVAPEILSDKEYGKEVDMWSIGVILYILLCGFPPFYDNTGNLRNLYSQIKKGAFQFPSPYWDNISEGAKDLIKRLLTVDPRKRYTGPQVLAHPWTKTASSEPIKGDYYIKNIKKYYYRRKLKKGINTILAILKLRDILHAVEEEGQ